MSLMSVVKRTSNFLTNLFIKPVVGVQVLPGGFAHTSIAEAISQIVGVLVGGRRIEFFG